MRVSGRKIFDHACRAGVDKKEKARRLAN